MPYYGVRHGRTVGVFDNWSSCAESVLNFSNNEFRKFGTYEEAKAYISGYEQDDSQDAGACGESPYNPYAETEEIFYTDWLGEVYVDGCCLGNGTPGARAGIGVYWGKGSPYNISERLTGLQTNQRAEIEAARRAIVQAKQMGYDNLNLYSDSKYFKQCIEEYIPKWEENGWMNSKGQPVVHAKEYQNLIEEMEDGTLVEIIHLNSHSGVFENDEADRLAKLGANKPLPAHSQGRKAKYTPTPMGPPRHRMRVVPKGTKPWEVDLFD